MGRAKPSPAKKWGYFEVYWKNCPPQANFLGVILRYTEKISVVGAKLDARWQDFQFPAEKSIPLSDFSIDFAYHYRISVSTLRTTTEFQYRLLRTTTGFQYRVCVPLSDFSIDFAYQHQISVLALRTTIGFQYRLCVPLSDFSIGFAYHYRISVSTLSCVPLSDFSTNFAYVDTNLEWYTNFCVLIWGFQYLIIWDVIKYQCFFNHTGRKNYFLPPRFFWRVFLFFILSKSNFPVWFFCIFLPCPPQAKKIRVLDRKNEYIWRFFLPAAGEIFWRFFAFCQPKKHCQILKCEFAYHCILQMEGTLTGVPIVDALITFL